MLAASRASDMSEEMFYSKLIFPVIATPKLDGIRCSTLDLPRPPNHRCEAVCRSLKSVPNCHIWSLIAEHCPPGLDGEIMTYHQDLFTPMEMRPFNLIQSDVMSILGTPIFKYHVFDMFDPAPPNGYRDLTRYDLRLLNLGATCLPEFCVRVPHTHIGSLSALLEYEASCVAEGYEGICFRTPNSPYKWGRSTLREGWLVKMKRFVTSEAEVIGVEEEMANNNPKAYNELGYAERSSHQANLVGKNRLGALICRHENGEFKIGTGFTALLRTALWDDQKKIIGRTVTYKHQPHGAKELPRIPVFIGFRDSRDIS